MTGLEPPPGLSSDAGTLWESLHADYELSPADVKILTEGLFAFDRCREAAKILDDAGGPVYQDRFGAPKQHPAAALELRHREQFLKAMRELRLDGDALPDPRPPRRGRS